MTTRILVVAPHHSFGDYNGANYYCDWVVDCLKTDSQVDFINHEGFWEISNDGKGKLLRKASLKKRSQALSSMNSLLFGCQYFEQRLVPSGFLSFFSTIDLSKYSHFVISFLHVYFALTKSGLKFPGEVRILTHNFDLDIYDRWIEGGGIRKFVAKNSKDEYMRCLSKIKDSPRIASISQSDADRYFSIFGARFDSVVCPVSSPDPYAVKCFFDANINLVFLGSLSTPFNVEALAYFRSNISKILSNRIKFTLHVCGSNPTQEVLNMVSEENWVLHENLPDDELDVLLSGMTAGILPFEYSQGVKLKIWKFYSLGLPVVGTEIFSDINQVGDFSYATNDFESWGGWLESLNIVHSKQSHSYWAREIATVRKHVVASLI